MSDAEHTTSDEKWGIREDGVDWLEVDDRIIALDLDQSVYLSTNETGKLLWEALAEGATIRDLTETLVENYGIDDKTALSDVSTFLQMLRDLGLLHDR